MVMMVYLFHRYSSGYGRARESVLFIGTEYSILYTSVYPPAGDAYPCAWCL
jgi:hypothetical protein